METGEVEIYAIFTINIFNAFFLSAKASGLRFQKAISIVDMQEPQNRGLPRKVLGFIG